MNTPIINAFLKHAAEKDGGIWVGQETVLAFCTELEELKHNCDTWRDAAQWSEGQHQHWKTVAVCTMRKLEDAVRERDRYARFVSAFSDGGTDDVRVAVRDGITLLTRVKYTLEDVSVVIKDAYRAALAPQDGAA